MSHTIRLVGVLVLLGVAGCGSVSVSADVEVQFAPGVHGRFRLPPVAYEGLKTKFVELLTSDAVLARVVKMPHVRDLYTILSTERPTAWVKQNLRTTWTTPDLVSVELAGDARYDPREAEVILQALTEDALRELSPPTVSEVMRKLDADLKAEIKRNQTKDESLPDDRRLERFDPVGELLKSRRDLIVEFERAAEVDYVRQIKLATVTVVKK